MLVHLPISQMSAGYEIGRNKGKGDGITSADALKSRKFKQVNSTKGGVAVKRSITCRWNFGSDAMLCTTSLTTNASFLSLILSHRMLEQRVAHHGNTQIGGAT